MNTAQLARACVAAADALIERRLWDRFPTDTVLLFDIPERGLILGSVMGAAGEEHGLMLLQGPRARDDFLAMMAGGHPRHTACTSTMLSVSLTRRKDIDPPFDRILKQARRTGRSAPLFFVREGSRALRPPRRKEQETLLYALRGLLAAGERGTLTGEGSLEAGILTALRIRGRPDRPNVTTETAAVVDGEEGALPELDVPADLADEPRLETTYLVGFALTPARITGENEAARAVAVLDAGDGKVLGVEAIVGFDLEAAAQSLFGVLRGSGKHARPGRPARMVFASEPLFRGLARGLGELGIECSYEAEVPALDAFFDGLDDMVGRQTSPEEGETGDAGRPAGAEPEISEPEVPEPDDVVRWKAVDLRVSERIGALCAGPALRSARAWRRYFGVRRRDSNLADDDRTTMQLSAYIDWFAHRYRAKPRSRTAAERLLTAPLTPAERRVLEARDAATPSVYHVIGIARGESVELCDVLSGRDVRVMDRSLSLSANTGVLLIARVYPVGSFHSCTLAGPPLPAHQGDAAIEFLRDELDVRIGDSIDPGAEHLLGRLWAWIEKQPDITSVEIRNSDGHALRWHSASFRVADPAALAAALERRDDVEEVEPGVHWAWQRGDTRLGSLRLFDDELLLEVNSEERFTQGRGWLEEVAGVAFRSVEKKNVDPREPDDRALDDRLPGAADTVPELAPGELSAIQEVLSKRCLAWVDERVPALGNQTPREACKTLAGRRRVARMIRSYPDPGGIPGLVVPRREMLAKLGLDAAEGDAEGGG